MAAATNNFTIKPTDGWVAVTSGTTTFLAIGANGAGPFSLGIGGSAPTTDGIRLNTEDRDPDDLILFPSGVAGKVWIKVDDYSNGAVQDSIDFGVISV